MASSRLSSFLLLFVACAVAAQAPVRLRGTITAFGGNVLSVGKDQVRVGEKTDIVFAQPISLADIKPGDFVGVTSARAADGTLTGLEVRRFPGAINPGHRPFDGGPNQTMTNATVGTVAPSSSGRELTLTYDGGAQKIAVPQDASVSELVPGKPSQLVPGARVNLTHGPDKVALRIQVSAPKPPQ